MTIVPSGNLPPKRAMMADPATQRSSEPAPPPATMSRYFIASGRQQAVGDLFFRHRPGADQFPNWLRDVHCCRPRTRTGAAIQHQVDAAVHHAENVDAAAARGAAGNVGT